jgi:hypothetical protein
LRCRVKLRARDMLRLATVVASGDSLAHVMLDEPTLAAPGQACVFYADDRVLGGGFIRPAAPEQVVDGTGQAALSPRPPLDGGVAQR